MTKLNKDSKNYFFKINPNEVLGEAIYAENQLQWFLQFFRDLKNDDIDGAKIPLAKEILQESRDFKAKKSESGKTAMEKRWADHNKRITKDNKSITNDSNGITDVYQTITNSSNNSSTSNNTQKEQKTAQLHSLASLWNDIIIKPSVAECGSGRLNKIRLRMKEKPDLSFWEELFKRIKQSPFLTGNNDKCWTADFDWIISNDTNYAKVMEGKYDSKLSSKPVNILDGPRPNSSDPNYAEYMRAYALRCQ